MPPSRPTPAATLWRLAGPAAEAGPDEELLRKFCADRDQTAFAVLVRRHGGLVLDVCRTVLRNDADAEDAFQATFVALAADARRVRNPAALAGWLHAVAWRTAGKARRARDRRRAHEARVPPRPDAPAPDPSWAEVRRAVHEEVNRLPDRYRASIVLFYLAGRTQDEVGRALGLSAGGAKKRLEVGRALLRAALDGRGFGPAVAIAAAAVALPAPAAPLASAATDLAVRFLTDRGAVPAPVLSLLSSGTQAMSAKIVFGAALLVGVATTVGLGVLQGGPADPAGQPAEPPAKAKAPPDTGRPAARPAADEEPKEYVLPGAAIPMDAFRDLEPGERLKVIKKRAGTGTPFTAAARGDLAATVVERGSVEPVNFADVICKVKAKDKEKPAATIKWVIDDGTMVKRGDRLAVLDDSDFRDRLLAATARERETAAALARATDAFGLVQKDVAVAVRLAEVDVKLAMAELNDAAAGASKTVLELKVEQAKLKLEQAQLRAKARETDAAAEKQAKAIAAQAAADRRRECEAELKQCELTAPADGVAVYFAPPAGRFGGANTILEPGATVREGQKLMRVVELKQFAIATRVHEAIVSTVRVGQAVKVRVDAFPDKVFTGKVTEVSPVASAADWRGGDVKVYPVTIAIEGTPAGLKPGMSAEVQILTAERKAVVQVPVKAVVLAGRDRFCYVKSGAELVERKVVTGAASPTAVEITDGLKEGDLVVTDPPGLLGQPPKGGR